MEEPTGNEYSRSEEERMEKEKRRPPRETQHSLTAALRMDGLQH